MLAKPYPLFHQNKCSKYTDENKKLSDWIKKKEQDPSICY